LIAVGFLLAYGLVGNFSRLSRQEAGLEPRVVEARGNLADDEKSTIALFQNASPSVVYITTSQVVHNDPFSFNPQEIPQGAGSGFIWSKAGHVVTNYHVIADADTAKVILADKTAWDAKLVGIAPHKDLAVLKIEAPADQLHPIPVGSSSDLQVGQKVFAIGNPFGLDHTLTTGVISGLDREIRSLTNRPITGVIQTDAAINPGNSGGPLLDSAGRLIAVNTAIKSPSGAYAGIGFAVPVDMVNRITTQLIKTGQVQRPGLGVALFEDRITSALGLKGVLIREVATQSAAEKAGLRATHSRYQLGDLIVGCDGQTVRSVDDFYKAIDNYQIGQTVTLQLLRDGQTYATQVTLQAVE